MCINYYELAVTKLEDKNSANLSFNQRFRAETKILLAYKHNIWLLCYLHDKLQSII